jgi:hypothetical protein
VVAVALASLAAAEAASDQAPLFPRSYVSTAVRENGVRLPLFERTKIHVDFERRKGSAGVSWRADCNFFGARVDITDTRLVTGQIVGTDQACRGVPRRQDRWTVRFFASDPKWRIRDEGRLRLRAGDRVIKLRRRGRRG